MSLLEMLGQQLGGDTLKNISRQLGTDEKATGNAVAAALPTILGALARNASTPEGAQSLSNALSKDHDGGILDDLAGAVRGAGSGPGESILGHVLGSRRPRVEAGLSQATGLDAASVGKMMTMLAPIVMGALGKAQRQQGLDANRLAGLLGQEREHAEKAAPQGMLGQLLDSDQDGDVDLSDIAKHGAGMLGKLFGGR